MKKFIIISLILIVACQNDDKKSPKKSSVSNEKIQTSQWVLNEDASTIHWIGYKTTGKIPVKGVFQNFNIKGLNPATHLKEALKHAKADINIYSVFSDNEERDNKLIGDLFEYMTDTEYIYARVEKITNDSIWVNIHLNAHEKIVPMVLKVDDQKGIVQFNGVIDLLKDFGANKALKKFHKACFDKHTGRDGISKTWSEVGISARLIFDKR